MEQWNSSYQSVLPPLFLHHPLNLVLPGKKKWFSFFFKEKKFLTKAFRATTIYKPYIFSGYSTFPINTRFALKEEKTEHQKRKLIALL